MELSSPSRRASSPCSPADTPVLSTPPSSPPAAYPTKPTANSTQVNSLQHRMNAFSVLGKRKTPLNERDDNARPEKRRALTKRKDSVLTQMHLSLGQKVEKTCKDCGMVYVSCSAEDRELHDQYHQQSNNGYDAGAHFTSKSTLVKVHKAPDTNDCLCLVTREDPPWKRKHARNVLNMVTQCLGACEIPDEELWRPPSKDNSHFQVWLYMRGNICIAALLIEMPLRKAMRVVNARQEQDKTDGLSAMERLRRRREEIAEQKDAPLVVSSSVCATALGICRVWTAPAFQHQGIAMQMLDIVYEQWSSGSAAKGKMNDVAFSQPTAAGTKLARKWFGKQSGWLVYS